MLKTHENAAYAPDLKESDLGIFMGCLLTSERRGIPLEPSILFKVYTHLKNWIMLLIRFLRLPIASTQQKPLQD